MERGSNYYRPPRPGVWPDQYSREREEETYFQRDPYHTDAYYLENEGRRTRGRFEDPFNAAQRDPYSVDHHENLGYHRAFGFSYTSGIRDIEEIKSRQRRHAKGRHGFEEEVAVPHWVTRQDSRQHPRREFLQERNRERFDRSPSPGRNARKWLPPVEDDLEGPTQSRLQIRHREPPMSHFRHVPLRSYSPVEEQRRRSVTKQAYRPRSSSLESYWGPARAGSDSNDPFGDAYVESSHSSPMQQRRYSGALEQPRGRTQPPKATGRPKEPFIPQPDYTWHKKKMRPSGRRPSPAYYS